MTSPSEIGGLPILAADVAMPYIGCWHIDGEASGEQAPTGSKTFVDHDIVFECTIVRATVIGGRVKFRAVGGKGKMSTTVPARHWVKPQVGTVVRDILAACGETLSSTVEASVLSARVDQWKRNEGPASRALQAICDNQGLIWRVLRDGTVWLGVESYPVTTVKHVLIDEDWSAGIIEIAPEAPDLLPGVTFRDQRIQYVVHQIRSGSLRSEASLSTPGGLLDRYLAGVRQEIQYSRSYPARVVSQNADGTLQVLLDDASMKGNGVNKVIIRTGLPGFECNVQRGARVSVEFENGDPSATRASLWELDASKVTSVKFKPGGIDSPACRVGDTIDAALPMGVPITGMMGAVPFTGVITVTAPVKAVLVGPGNSKLLI